MAVDIAYSRNDAISEIVLAMPTFALLRWQAEKKGASLMVVGLIIAVYQLVSILVSPVVGYHVSYISRLYSKQFILAQSLCRHITQFQLCESHSRRNMLTHVHSTIVWH